VLSTFTSYELGATVGWSLDDKAIVSIAALLTVSRRGNTGFRPDGLYAVLANRYKLLSRLEANVPG